MDVLFFVFGIRLESSKYVTISTLATLFSFRFLVLQLVKKFDV